MKVPILTIAIPTFNRVQLLRKTIAALLFQLHDEVELLVMDNCSTDGTHEYLQTLAPKVRNHKHASNIGSDNNFLSCLTHARGEYVWTLSDDDFYCSNTVHLVLEAIRDHGRPGVIHLRKQFNDSVLSTYTSIRADTGWSRKNRSQFIADVGVWITFCSSTVVRRNCLDMVFLQQQSGTSLVPAAIPLQAAGVSNEVIISTTPLVLIRSSPPGPLPGPLYTLTFTRDLKRLLKSCRGYGYSKAALDAVYSSSLASAMPYYVEYCPLTIGTIRTIFLNSFGYSAFYMKVAPSICRKILRAVKEVPRRALERKATSGR